MNIKELGVPDEDVVLGLNVYCAAIKNERTVDMSAVLGIDMTPVSDIFKKWAPYIFQIFLTARTKKFPIKILVPERGMYLSIQFMPTTPQVDNPSAWIVAIQFTEAQMNIAVHDSETVKPNLDWYNNGNIPHNEFGKFLPWFISVMYQHCSLYY